jgi:hypothetical protein
MGVMLDAWNFISDDQKTGMIVTSQLSFSRICTMLASLCLHKVKSDEINKELRSILSNAASVEAERNVVVHSTYGLPSDDGEILRIKASIKRKSGLTVNQELVDVDRLNTLADDIGQVTHDLTELMLRIHKQGHYALPFYGNPNKRP